MHTEVDLTKLTPYQREVLTALARRQSWSRSSEQFFRVDKWSLCRG